MKNSWQILTLLVAIALVVLSVKMVKVSSEDRIVDTTEVVLENIMTRSSVRSYTSQEVEPEKIEIMLRAAMAAPTAGNRQPWSFIVVTDREVLDSFPAIIPGTHMADKAQLAIVVCGNPSLSFPDQLSEYWVQDCSAATENILLSAHALGLGAVWCGAYPNTPEDRVGQMRELLNIPEDIYALNVVVIGYPDSEPIIKDKWQPSRVHYNRF